MVFKDPFSQSEEVSFDTTIDDLEDEKLARSLDDVLKEVQDHLTNEELLCISLYKNSKKQRNAIYKVYIEKHHGKKYTTSGITRRKNKIFKVLNHVGELLRFKRTNSIDYKLRDVLTKKQYLLLIMYEKRWDITKIRERLKSAPTTTTFHKCFYRAIDRLQESTDPQIKRYLELFGNVMHFSRKYPTSKR